MSVLKLPVQAVADEVAAECVKPRWYAVYTRSRHEKFVASELAGKAVETFLPLFETVRRWKNGNHLLHLPLFPSYVFVRIVLAERLDVLKVPGVVRLVGFNSTPTPLAEGEVEGLRRALSEGVRAEPYSCLSTGRRVRITTGPLTGRVGILVRRKGSLRMVLSSELMQRSILLDIDALAVEPISNRAGKIVNI